MANLDVSAIQQTMQAVTTAAQNSGDIAAQQAMMLQNMMNNGGLGMILGWGAGIFGVVALLALLLIVIPLCKMFHKMGNEWYEALVPGHNCYIFITNAGKPGWWIFMGLLLLIPVLGWIVGLILAIIMHFVVAIGMAKKFGKSTGFGVGMALLPFIFLPILGYGSAVYTK